MLQKIMCKGGGTQLQSYQIDEKLVFYICGFSRDFGGSHHWMEYHSLTLKTSYTFVQNCGYSSREKALAIGPCLLCMVQMVINKLYGTSFSCAGGQKWSCDYGKLSELYFEQGDDLVRDNTDRQVGRSFKTSLRRARSS